MRGDCTKTGSPAAALQPTGKIALPKPYAREGIIVLEMDNEAAAPRPAAVHTSASIPTPPAPQAANCSPCTPPAKGSSCAASSGSKAANTPCCGRKTPPTRKSGYGRIRRAGSLAAWSGSCRRYDPARLPDAATCISLAGEGRVSPAPFNLRADSTRLEPEGSPTPPKNLRNPSAFPPRACSTRECGLLQGRLRRQGCSPRTPLPYRPASPTRQGPCRRRRKRRPCRRSLSAHDPPALPPGPGVAPHSCVA